MMEYPHIQSINDISINEQLDDVEYSRLKRLIAIIIGTGLLSGLIYFFSGNKIFAGAPLALTTGILCLINTNFAFLTLFFIPVLEEWFVLVQGESIAGGFSLSKLVGILVVVSYLLTRISKGIQMSGPLKLMVVIVAVMGFSSIWSSYIMFTFVKSITYVLYVCLAIIFFNTVDGVKCLRLMLWSLFGGNLLIALLLAVGKGIHEGEGRAGALGGVVAATSEEGRLAFAEGGVGSNVIAIFLAFSVMLGFYLIIRSGLWIKIGIILAELLLLFVLIKTESRSGLLYVVIVPMATYVLASQKGYRLKSFMGVMFLSILAAVLFYAVIKTDILPSEAKERIETSLENRTLTGRTIIWQAGKDFFLERPFQGWGWGMFPLKYGDVSGGRSAHSNYVMVAVELGIIGLILFGWLFFKLLFETLKIPDYPSKWLSIMCLMWLFTTGIGMTSMLTRVWWYVLALLVRLIFVKQSDFSYGQMEGELLEMQNEMPQQPTL